MKVLSCPHYGSMFCSLFRALSPSICSLLLVRFFFLDVEIFVIKFFDRSGWCFFSLTANPKTIIFGPEKQKEKVYYHIYSFYQKPIL